MALILFLAVSVLFSLSDAYTGSLAMGGIICEEILIVPLALVTVIFLLHQRKTDSLWFTDTDYFSYVAVYAAAGLILSVSAVFLPDFLIPAGLVSFLMASSGNSTLSIVSSAICIISVAYGHGYDGAIYGLLISEAVIATELSDLILRTGKKQRILVFILISLVFTAFTAQVRYMIRLKLEESDLYFSLTLSIITAAVAVIVFPVLYRWIHREKRYRYETILDDDYTLLNELKLFSQAEYDRARRLSVISLKAAREIGADAVLSAAGGLYYRIGLLRGDREIEYATEIAAEHGFPEQLIRILYEYQGLIRKPTSKESAIVHMCDALMRRFEAISKQGDQMESGWNRQMVIYSTLNDLSVNGFYDDSGITMNQFLKIRDVLAKEL